MIDPREAFNRNKERSLTPREPKRRPKFNYVGVPTIFKLDLACATIIEAFCDRARIGGVYLVGSALQRPDWRDIDLVCILDDDAFAALFPDVHKPGGTHCYFEHDPRWLLLTIAISEWLTREAGAPVDFKFQPMTFANARHSGSRHSMGMRMAKQSETPA